MNDSVINWRLVSYTVGGCWLIFAFMWLLGHQMLMFLNPVPIVVKAIWGVIIYGYVGGTSGYTLETIFVYWTIIGLLLAWLLHKSKRKTLIITLTAVLHLVLSVLALFPAMLIGGR